MGSLQLRKMRRVAQIRNKRGFPGTIWQRKATRLRVQAAAVLPKCKRHNYDGCCGSACVLQTDDDGHAPGSPHRQQQRCSCGRLEAGGPRVPEGDKRGRLGILAEAEVIGGTDNLRKNQLQHLKTLQSLLGAVQMTTGTLKPDNAAALWEKINTGYTVPLAEDLRIMTTWRISGDFIILLQRYKDLSTDTEDFHHDIFLLGNRDNQQELVKTKINKFYATGQRLISNIDNDDLTKQLTNCTNKTQVCGMSEHHLVSECHHPYEQYDVQFIYHDVRMRDTCWHLYPELATEKWREMNKDKIIPNNRSSSGSGGGRWTQEG
ncbi:uncharacterized protein PADG_06398 [Paracoccidioides brasiliensis Pb18]|uniref:Uncharacterized protein n=1 Tax=Paracoccidioides brasiliensis (strain Pb18) TaxID=502780 RepID=C1GGG1_PARBD|nr:uncharacterized protein PADG_06398 [Paracoccidioides brasiliensis Pb18]EEH50319.2 hypothetical protein PADG_06398 [Paracoccidioides brasiliensis Pb18]